MTQSTEAFELLRPSWLSPQSQVQSQLLLGLLFDDVLDDVENKTGELALRGQGGWICGEHHIFQNCLPTQGHL